MSIIYPNKIPCVDFPQTSQSILPFPCAEVWYGASMMRWSQVRLLWHSDRGWWSSDDRRRKDYVLEVILVCHRDVDVVVGLRWLPVTETAESKTEAKGRLVCAAHRCFSYPNTPWRWVGNKRSYVRSNNWGQVTVLTSDTWGSMSQTPERCRSCAIRRAR